MINEKIATEEIEFDCVYNKTIYSKDNFWIMSVKVDFFNFPDVIQSKYNTVTIKGNLFEMDKDALYHIKAIPTESKYGIAYDCVSCTRNIPKTKSDIENFLKTILTPLQAKTLSENYPDIIDIVKEDRVSEIDFSKLKGITPSNFEKIKAKIIENFSLIDTCAVFYNLLSLNVIRKMTEKYKSIDSIKSVLNFYPYSCLIKLDGIGFKTADDILITLENTINIKKKAGEAVNFEFSNPIKESRDRCKAVIDYTLDENEKDGNTKMSLEDLKAKIKALTPECYHFYNEIIKDNNSYYLDELRKYITKFSTYKCEEYIAKTLIEARNHPVISDWNIEGYNKIDEFELTKEQISVQNILKDNSFAILQGPAGSGKTSSVQALIKMLRNNSVSFIQMTPTGKSAKVLKKYSHFEASTIHRALGYNSEANGGFNYNEDNKLPYDLVIVDEFSMVGCFLMCSLLKAINFNKTKLLLIGDQYQLPSIECSRLLGDFLDSKEFPVIELNKIFRYGESGILTVATDCRNGREFLPAAMKKDMFTIGNSYVFIPQTKENAVEYTVKMYERLLQNNEPEDMVVIVAMNKNEHGTIAINNRIQEAINPSKEKIKTNIGGIDTEFRLNDIVMNTVNNYSSIICDESGYIETKPFSDDALYTTLIANGDTGKIVNIKKDGMVVRYDDKCIWVSKNELNHLQLAYCITAHKSQGSGYKNIIVLSLTSQMFMLDSSLLYTSLTRAKEHIFQVGSEYAINTAVKKKKALSRKTNMLELLKNKF